MQLDQASAAQAPEAVPVRGLAFVLVAARLGLILLTIHLFELEPHRPFLGVMYLAVAGFAIHAWLPARFQLPFFCLLSLGGIVLLFGWPESGWIIGIGAGLIALCHLPLPLFVRAILLIGAGVQLAAFRVEDLSSPVWPVLASMFMFRIIVYLHDREHLRERPSLFFTVAYFFPLPNICFPFFPVLDFRKFRDTYRSEEDYATYQTGVDWIVRGLVHLLLYRLVKYHVMPAPHELAEVPQLVLFLAAFYALYLKISGWFHIITGVLHLFGFALPRTHDNYFLAASFTDIWRRINIYWKDFLMKVFFFPMFFRLRRWGDGLALVVSVLGVFLTTWLLHAYQLFWLLGEPVLTWKDGGLWLTVGVLATVNFWLELRRGGRSRAEPDLTSLPRAIVRSAKIAGMFLLISLFWAVWSIPGFLISLRVLTLDPERTLQGTLWVVAVLLGIIAVGAVGQVAWARLIQRPWDVRPRSLWGSAAMQLGVLLALVALGLPAFTEQLDQPAAEVVASLRQESFTIEEAGRIAQGYYEELTEAPVQASPLLGFLGGRERKSSANVLYEKMTVPSDALLERELIPRWQGDVLGSWLTINEFGMRDRSGLSQHKPAGVQRLAVVGSSIVMGYGVGDEEVFSRRLEQGLNAQRGKSGPRCEVLNFGTGRSYAIHRRALIDRKVWDFGPDALWYFAHQDELAGPVRHLSQLAAKDAVLPYPYLQEVLRAANVPPGTSAGVAEAQLQPFARQIVGGIYRDLVTACRKRGVQPVWVYLPMPGVVGPQLFRDPKAEMIRLAREAGFVVVDLSGWYGNRAAGEVKLGAQDPHANALGHRLIAERLLAEIQARPELLPARK